MAKQIMPSYKVKRNFTDPDNKHYLVYVEGHPKPYRIRKVEGHGKFNWYARTRYFVSLRDSIIYCAFGVC